MPAWGGQDELVALLLTSGASANVQQRDQATPLHVAALRGHITVAQTLLNRGADTGVRLRTGWTASDVANNCGYEDLAQMLRQHRSITGLAQIMRQGRAGTEKSTILGILASVPEFSDSSMTIKKDDSQPFEQPLEKVVQRLGMDQFLKWRPRPLRDQIVVPVRSMEEVMTSLHEKLQPVEVDSHLKTLCEKATEKRESALDEIRSWLSADSTDTNILLLQGDAWSGKSVFFACTVDELKRDHATAIFVCDYSDLDRSDARGVITTLASQIAEFVGDQARVRMDMMSKQDVQSLPLSTLFERLITRPLNTLNGARVAIAVDALDELRADVDELWCIDIMVKNHSLFGRQATHIVAGFQDPPAGVSKAVAYACRHWYSHFKATAGNLLSSQDLVEFLAVSSFGPGLLVRGVRDNDEDIIRLAFGCSHDSQTGHSESEKAKNCLLVAEASKLLPSPLLHEAAKRNRAGICRLLLDCGGVEINAVGPRPASGTALHAAAQARADDVFGLLLDKGVNPHVLDANGRTASDLYPEYFEMLEKKSKRKAVLQ
ncbi:hypothetical protein HK405_013214, partial [Cladochytrium tenue]